MIPTGMPPLANKAFPGAPYNEVKIFSCFFNSALRSSDTGKIISKKVCFSTYLIFGINFNYAAEEDLVEYYSGDIYIGKRLFILPHFAHMYFKIGPSIAKYNYDFVDRYLHTETRIGAFYSMGLAVPLAIIF